MASVASMFKRMSSDSSRINDAVHQQGLLLEGHVKRDIAKKQWSRKDGTRGPSVDTGAFLNSVFTNNSKPMVSIVSSDDIKYAPYLEYGTSTRAKLFSGPRHHFKRSMLQRKPAIVKAITKATIKII